MIGITNVGAGSDRKIVGTIRGTNSPNLVITGIPFKPKAYAIVITREPYDIAMRAQYGGIGFAYGYYTDRSSNYGGGKSYANNIPQSSLYKASYSNGILTIAKGASWNEYLWVGFDYKYIILG
ncbi:MAG: hypothetical protein J7E02_23565 [Escherichia coli]|jgi:hypothetical protein|nr:hypothetical protein [Escherichia coli]